MVATSHSPQQLRDALCDIFPTFTAYWEDDDNPHLESGAFTYHGLMLEFTSFFGKELGVASEEQLKALGELVNAVVSRSGELESAVSTCFLEHLHQIRAGQALGPYLSHEAKAKSHD